MEFKEILKKVGLNEKEVEIYSALLELGEQKISDLLKKTKLKRGDLYYALDSLVERNLVIKEDKDKKLHFKLSHPTKISGLFEAREKELNLATKEVFSVLPEIVSIYNLTTDKPSTRYYEGVDGLLAVYRCLNNSGEKKLFLIRSIYDDKHPEIDKVINKQIKKQMKLQIQTKAITPLVAESKKTFLTLDKERLVERRIADPKTLSLPAQILIWGTTVAIISLRDKIIATVIENRDITETFKNLFHFIWQNSEIYHNEIMRQWSALTKAPQVSGSGFDKEK